MLCFRYASRNNIPPPGYPPITSKPMPLMANLILPNEPPPGYRSRYDAPPFEDIPPGVEPTVPGFEPSPFEKPIFGPSGTMERDRLPPSNYRDPYRAPYVEGPAGYRDNQMPPLQSDIPGPIAEHSQRYRDNFRATTHPYRDQGPVSYRDGQPYRETGSQASFRDNNFRNGPPSLFRDNNFRNNPYRDPNFRENVPHNFRDGSAPFRPPSVDPREPNSVVYPDPNYREGFRDENNTSRDVRPGYRGSVRNRGGSRRNPNDHERHRERDGRERDRFNENREAPDRTERPRDVDKRSGNRENREERSREYDRNRDYEKERDRGHEKQSPDRKQRVSPKRSRDTRERKQSETRARSRDRESRKEKKEERTRDKSSAERNRDHKEKDKKVKDRKKKKREKEKEVEKKKKRDKKDKKDKDGIKKEEDEQEITDSKQDANAEPKENTDQTLEPKAENPESLTKTTENDNLEKSDTQEKTNNDLYGDEGTELLGKEVQIYNKTEEKEDVNENKSIETLNKEEPFDGIELQVPADELEVDIEATPKNNNNKEMLAPLPALSKWEVEDDNVEKSKEPGEITSPEEEEDGGKVTSEVIKRAENAIFSKAISTLRPIEIKKISSDRLKLYSDDTQIKGSLDNIQITVPVLNEDQQLADPNKKKRYSKTPPPRLSVKERLGGKVEEVRKVREPRVVQSTVERVKSRSKTPKHEQIPYRRVTVERDRNRKPEIVARLDGLKGERKISSDVQKPEESYRFNNDNDYKKRHYGKVKDEMKSINDRLDTNSQNIQKNDITQEVKVLNERERKKSVLDEAHFEPDYDENVESDNEAKVEPGKKREHSRDPLITGTNEPKKAKFDTETIKLDLTNVKKKPDSDSESSSDSEYSYSSSSSDARKRKKKKKKNKKKKKRAASDSDSESDSSSDDHKKKKKKRKHKKKSSKKKKKSKHK